ncbi:MAG: alpha-mannosidase [Clostridia bacterium]|nr:alpha-mannosidase [Clostridia bacterium]
MYNEKLKTVNYIKLDKVIRNYGNLIFERIGELENVQGFCTAEQYRSVPEEGWAPLAPGTKWGGYFINLWVKGQFTVPAEYDGVALYAQPHTDGKELLYFVDGHPRGIFSWEHPGVSGSHAFRVIDLNPRAGNVYELAFECYDKHPESGSDWFSLNERNDEPYEIGGGGSNRTYSGVSICVRNDVIKDLFFDVQELLTINRDAHASAYLKAHVHRVLDQVDALIVQCPQHYPKEVWMEAAKKCLAVTRPFFSSQNDRMAGHVCIIGHTHLDTAWLWPYKETIRKAARTFSNVLQLMDQYPDFKFMMSTPLHAEWMRQYYPEIFEGMQRSSAEGRFELNGGAYVECDCNISGGEMMVRQFLKGQQFTKEYFGHYCDTFWLLDTFGYNGNIPQLMQGCGLKYFVTNKTNMNEVNPVEHHAFLWRGIDGTEVLAHIPDSGGHADSRYVLYAADTNKDKDATDHRLLPFGFGDGGGGPTFGLIEEAERVMHAEGEPETEMMLVSDFMKILEQDKDRMHVLDGEIYLEFHRGTLTQNHLVKRKMRKAELAYRDMEYMNVLSGEKKCPDADRWLKTILLNQFHDILPGTSINIVYDTYNEEMDEVKKGLDAAKDAFAGAMQTPHRNRVTVYNTLSHERKDPLSLYGEWVSVKGHPVQHFYDVAGRKTTAVGCMDVPSFGSVTLTTSPAKEDAQAKASSFSYDRDAGVIETPFAHVELDENGYIGSFVDKRSGRELRRAGGNPLNAFLMAEDCPKEYDNWNIDSDAIDNLQMMTGFIGRSVVSCGEVELRIRSEFHPSDRTRIQQDMIFYANSPRVDFQTMIGWDEKNKLLKAGFDLNIRAREARCEIQYGHVMRPTHQSDRYSVAMFEVCNHKWTDISESRFGVAVLNDCKYGVSFIDCNLALTLHKGGIWPDHRGDRGLHEVTYSLLPHGGDFSAANVILPAYELNVPYLTKAGVREDGKSFLRIDADNVICECVKPAEDREDAYVLRLYESERNETQTVLHLKNCSRVYETDMLERISTELPVGGSDGTKEVPVHFRPFEIKTLLIEKQKEQDYS